MPRFYFDLVGPESVLDQHGVLLGELQFAAHAAERLAAELFTVRPELRGTASVILFDEHRSNLIYCIAIAPDPAPQGRDVSEAVTPAAG
jgi:hypothetical protein